MLLRVLLSCLLAAHPTRFNNEYEVEVAARVGRVWDDDDNHDPDALDVAETVLKVSGWVWSQQGTQLCAPAANQHPAWRRP